MACDLSKGGGGMRRAAQDEKMVLIRCRRPRRSLFEGQALRDEAVPIEDCAKNPGRQPP